MGECSSGISAATLTSPPTTSGSRTNGGGGGGGVSTVVYGDSFMTTRVATVYRGLPRSEAQEVAYSSVLPSSATATDEREYIDLWSNPIIAQVRRDTSSNAKKIAYNDIVFVVCDTDRVRGQLEAECVWSRCWDFVTMWNSDTKKMMTADPVKFSQTEQKMKRISDWFNGRGGGISAEVKTRTILVATYNFDEVPSLYYRMKTFSEHMFVVSVSAETMEKVFGKVHRKSNAQSDGGVDSRKDGDANLESAKAGGGTKVGWCFYTFLLN